MTKKTRRKREYLATRRQRVRDLYLGGGLGSRSIADKLVAEGTIETLDESLASAIRLVRADIAEIRAEIDSERLQDGEKAVAGNAADARERELERLRHAYQKQREIVDDDSIVTTTMITPNGEIVMEKPKWPPGVRQKAAKDAALIASAISKVEAAIAPAAAGSDPETKREPEGFKFEFSGKSVDSLIGERIAGAREPEEPTN